MVLRYQSPLRTAADRPARTADRRPVARYIQAIASPRGRPRSRKVPPPMHHARLLAVATLSLVLVAACTTASAGWTYVPAPSMTPIPSTAASAGPSASGGGDNVVQISALGIKYEQTAVTVKADTLVPDPVRQQGRRGHRTTSRSTWATRTAPSCSRASSSTASRPAPTPSRRSMPGRTPSSARSIRR